jgi:hypothetical protein
MKRGIKKGSNVYAFLQSTGLLEQGTAAEIEQAKKQYWAIVRSEWKRNKRQTTKSYTVCFNDNELKLLTQSVIRQHLSFTAFIKQASLCYGKNTFIVDKKIVGEIREAILLHYNNLQTLGEEKMLPETITNKLLQEVLIIETKILSFVKQL